MVGGSNGEKGTHLSCASIGGDYSKAKGSSWEMGGATGGGRDGIPRWSRILRVISELPRSAAAFSEAGLKTLGVMLAFLLQKSGIGHFKYLEKNLSEVVSRHHHSEIFR